MISARPKGRLRDAGREHFLQLVGRFRLRELNSFELLVPAALVEVKAGDLHLGKRQYAVEFEFRNIGELVALDSVATCSRSGTMIAASRAAYSTCECDSSFVLQSLTCRDLSSSAPVKNCADVGERVPPVLITRRYKLAGEKRIVDTFDLDAEMVPHPFRVELRIMRDLYVAAGRPALPERRQIRVVLSHRQRLAGR